MVDQLIDAVLFELTGEGASVTYDTRSQELHYRGPTRPPLDDFIDVTETSAPLDTPIGRLVTATLGAVQDGDIDTVTVLLPHVRLSLADGEGGGADAAFETVGIWTTTRSSIGGPAKVAGIGHLYAHGALQGSARSADASGSCEFSAYLDQEPPGPWGLRVEGHCTFASTGYEVGLVRHEPQGPNARDLQLDLVVTPPTGISGPGFTTYPVFYAEQTSVEFETVTILPDGVSIEVQIIS